MTTAHAKRVCAEPGCHYLVRHGPRCPAHDPGRTADTRPAASRRGYGARWRHTRTRYLRHHPDCAVCGDRATQVHHLDGQGPLAPAGHAPDNLQALCHSCHSRITTTRPLSD